MRVLRKASLEPGEMAEEGKLVKRLDSDHGKRKINGEHKA